MKTCKIKPLINTCIQCSNLAQSYDEIPDCKKCSYNTTRYEIVQIGSNFWGGYVIVFKNGKLEKVSLNRIYDLKEE